MAKPLIAYLSMLRLSTTSITDPGTESGFAIGNIKDLKSHSIWKSNQTAAAVNIDIDAGAGGANADYIALVNHNLNTLGATVRVLADTVTPPVAQVLAATTPGQDTVSLLTFTAPGLKRYWRITINHASLPFAAKPFIGEALLGMKTSLPEYLAPSFDPFFGGKEVSGSRSEGGHYLGATIRGRTHRGAITFGGAGAARSAYTSDLNAFIDYAEDRKPFVFVVDTDDADFSAARYVKLTDDGEVGRHAVGSSWSRLILEIPVEEAYMEPVTA